MNGTGSSPIISLSPGSPSYMKILISMRRSRALCKATIQLFEIHVQCICLLFAGDSSSENNMIIIIVGSVLGATTLISLLVALTGCICYVRVKRRQRHNEGQPLLQGQAQPRQPLHNLQNNDEAGN